MSKTDENLLILTGFTMFSEVDDTEAATCKFLNEVILLLNIAIVGVNEPSSLRRGGRTAIVFSN